ncbi:MAG: hypothetical protein HC867_08345, partial [Bacteroidia bacterium]|nr:hypothetical protein [Bacteroidia bacterium]
RARDPLHTARLVCLVSRHRDLRFLCESGPCASVVRDLVSADLSGQANHLGVTLQADIIKQKLPTNNGGYLATKHGKTNKLVYEKLTSDHPIDLCRYQVLNCYSGKIGLINSGGESKGMADLADSVYTAVINKRAGGMGLILGRKAFQRPFKEGVEILQATQDVYLDESITIA